MIKISYIFSYCTDKGPYRDVNQDALCFRAASYSGNNYYMAVICDGMGGLSSGEMASSYAVHRMTEWFSGNFASMITQKKGILDIRTDLDEFLHAVNNSMNRYSEKNDLCLGTTITAAVFFENEEKMLIAHVGDTRVYKITEENIEILTHDHSVVGEEVLEGILTEESANNDERQNQLTKCLGADFDDISYDYIIQKTEKCCYMLCSDGFRKKISVPELHENLRPSRIDSKENADIILRNLTELNIEREETDNITSAILRLF